MAADVDAVATADIVDHVALFVADDEGDRAFRVVGGLHRAIGIGGAHRACRHVNVNGQSGLIKAVLRQVSLGGGADIGAQAQTGNAGQEILHGLGIGRIGEGRGDAPLVGRVCVGDIASQCPLDDLLALSEGDAVNAGFVKNGLADLAKGVTVDEEAFHRAVGEDKQPVIAADEHVAPGAVVALVAHTEAHVPAVSIDDAGLVARLLQAVVRQVVNVICGIVGQHILCNDGGGAVQKFIAFIQRKLKGRFTGNDDGFTGYGGCPGGLAASADGNGNDVRDGCVHQLDGGVRWRGGGFLLWGLIGQAEGCDGHAQHHQHEEEQQDAPLFVGDAAESAMNGHQRYLRG